MAAISIKYCLEGAIAGTGRRRDQDGLLPLWAAPWAGPHDRVGLGNKTLNISWRGDRNSPITTQIERLLQNQMMHMCPLAMDRSSAGVCPHFCPLPTGSSR